MEKEAAIVQLYTDDGLAAYPVVNEHAIRDDCYSMMFLNYDGRTYSVFFEDADETMVCTGTKEDDNADVATPVPSTNAARNENPYDEIPLFRPVECNGYADEDGELHITAVKGEPDFLTD